MKAPVFILSLALSASAFAETPSAQDLLVKPEVSERPVPAEQEAPGAAPAASPAAPPTEAVEGSAENAEATSDDLVPPPFPVDRYEALWKRSPFQLESVAPPVESAGLAQRYALTGLAEIGGEPIAFLMERATQQRMMVKKEGGESGLSLVQVDVVTEKSENSSATIRQGAEVGVLKFDAGPAPPMAPQPMMAPAMPQAAAPMAPQPPQAIPAAQIPGQPMPPQIPGQTAGVPQQVIPGVVPSVPGPGIPQNGQVQQPGQQPMPPPRVIRRRAIVPAAP